MSANQSNAAPKPAGRPRKDESITFYDNKFYGFLLANLPSDLILHGRVDIAALAKSVNASKMTVYRWLNYDLVSIAGAKALVAISEDTEEVEKQGAITRESLIPFLFN